MWLGAVFLSKIRFYRNCLLPAYAFGYADAFAVVVGHRDWVSCECSTNAA